MGDCPGFLSSIPDTLWDLVRTDEGQKKRVVIRKWKKPSITDTHARYPVDRVDRWVNEYERTVRSNGKALGLVPIRTDTRVVNRGGALCMWKGTAWSVW